MELTEEEKMYLKIYKGVGDEYFNNVDTSNMKQNELVNLKLRQMQLWYQNINLFLNFINNPDSINIKNIMVEDVSDMVIMIKSLINTSCKSALFYEPQDTFYRYENINNLNGYKDGYLGSFKSTSWNTSSAEEFKNNNTTLLEYNHNGFFPFIPVDKIIDGGLLSDEHEFLIPPYLDCNIKDNKVEIGFYDNNNLDENDYAYHDMMFLMSTKDGFNQKFNEDKENGIVSNELKEYCKEMKEYLSTYARLNYRKYQELYNKENNDSKKM